MAQKSLPLCGLFLPQGAGKRVQVKVSFNPIEERRDAAATATVLSVGLAFAERFVL